MHNLMFAVLTSLLQFIRSSLLLLQSLYTAAVLTNDAKPMELVQADYPGSAKSWSGDSSQALFT